MAFTLLEFYYDFDLLKSSWRQEKKIKKETSVSSFWKKKQLKEFKKQHKSCKYCHKLESPMHRNTQHFGPINSFSEVYFEGTDYSRLVDAKTSKSEIKKKIKLLSCGFRFWRNDVVYILIRKLQH